MHPSVASRARAPTNKESRIPTDPGGNQYEHRRRSSRIDRPSFQGLSIIEGRSNRSSSSGVAVEAIAKMKLERRKKSIDVLRHSAQSAQIREMIESTMGDAIQGFIAEGNPEERLQAIMTKAKERGMSTDKIFSFFNGGNPQTIQITKKSFLDALEKLGDTVIFMSDEELSDLVSKFDVNNDGQISIAEFKNYCYYQIPSIAWKAERQRLETSGEMKKLKAQLHRKFSGEIKEMVPCGEQVYRTTKLFWKANLKLDVRLYYTKCLDVITLQIHDLNDGRQLQSIHVCKSNCGISTESLLEAISSATHTSKTRTGEEEEVAKKMAEWEYIANHLTARIHLEKVSADDGSTRQQKEKKTLGQGQRQGQGQEAQEQHVYPVLRKLAGDDLDCLVIKKPINLLEPPEVSGVTNSPTKEFNNVIASFQRESRSARTSRQSAEAMSSLVEQALSEIHLEASTERQKA
mmetsp:Transcript_26315/g.38767  ORF Transcript_26315/g.38767 Transcript_26315/m.38767 type:complete len:461 (-) Transcript_26315:506-1888(-)